MPPLGDSRRREGVCVSCSTAIQNWKREGCLRRIVRSIGISNGKDKVRGTRGSCTDNVGILEQVGEPLDWEAVRESRDHSRKISQSFWTTSTILA